jgi:hypothetical protein
VRSADVDIPGSGLLLAKSVLVSHLESTERGLDFAVHVIVFAFEDESSPTLPPPVMRESTIVSEFVHFSTLTLVPRTPAMSPPPPILIHVLVRTRHQRSP